MNTDAPLVDSRPSHEGYRPDIQGLRALAVLLVILCHAQVPHLAGGYIGVDVFFVISGFVITSLLLRQPRETPWRNLGRFYARRVRRILPASALVLIGTLVATYYWLGPVTGVQLSTDTRYASLFWANFHFSAVAQNYFQQGQLSLITHYWSLSVEEQFYFVIPFLVFGASALLAVQRRLFGVMGILFSVVVASGVWSIYQTNVNPTSAYYAPFTRFWELALGGLVATAAIAWDRGSVPRQVVAVVQWTAVGVIVFSALFFTANAKVPGCIMWGPCLAVAVLLHPWGAAQPWTPSALFARQPLRYIGDISYSLYLFHYAWLKIPLAYALSPMSAWSRVLQVLGAVVCAVISYHVLENPIRRSRKLDAHPGWSLVGVAIVTIGGVWLVAGLCQAYWTL